MAVEAYSIAYATCARPTALVRSPRTIGAAVGNEERGAWRCEVFRDGSGSPWVTFHAFTEPHVGYPSSRYMHLAPLRVDEDNVDVVATA